MVGFDGREHRLIEPGVVVFSGPDIVHVGRSFAGEVSETIDASGMLVIPGQISTHAHVSAQEGSRLLIDTGRRDFFRSGFLNYLPTKIGGGRSFLANQDSAASLRFGMASLLRHGITTVVAFAPGGPSHGTAMLDAAAEFGIRVYYSPSATGGRYHFDDEGKLIREWDEAAGLQALDRAAEFISEHDGAQDGRFRGIMTIDEFYFSTETMRRRARDFAANLDVGLTLHCSEQLTEFHECVRQNGTTPVGLLAAEGLLGPRTILAHCLYIAGHSAVAFPYGDDLRPLAEAGATVAHSPVAFSRRGVALETFQRYVDAGINVALGTDTFPLDLFAEMRMASVASKVLSKNHEDASAKDVFTASNLAGARALGRGDLGRLAPGAKADILLVDFRSLTIGPAPDPIKALVHLGAPNMVDTVIVDGRTLMRNKQLLVCDEAEILNAAKASSRRVWDSFAEYDWAARKIEDAFPPALKPWQD